jgi:pentatricopeptide repeat protein
MFGQTGTEHEALQFLDSIGSSGLHPTTTTFALLMSALVQRQSYHVAVMVWQRIQQSELTPDSACQDAYIEALVHLVRMPGQLYGGLPAPAWTCRVKQPVPGPHAALHPSWQCLV